MNQYVLENRNFITSSKLKDFLRCPFLYKLKYIEEIDIPEEEESRSLVIGRALDDWLSFGETYFKDHYFLDEGKTKDQLCDDLIIEDSSLDRKQLMKKSKDELMLLVYGDISKKERLTDSEVKILLHGIEELQRQPLLDFEGGYETQKEVVAEYTAKNGMVLKLKARFDRFHLEKGMIRDLKFMKDVTSFEWDADDFGYFFQGGFYETLATVKWQKKFRMIFDVISKNIDAAKSTSFELTEQRLTEQRRFIKQTLDHLAECIEKNEWTPISEFERMEKCFSRKGFACPMYRVCPATAIQRNFVDL